MGKVTHCTSRAAEATKPVALQQTTRKRYPELASQELSCYVMFMERLQCRGCRATFCPSRCILPQQPDLLSLCSSHRIVVVPTGARFDLIRGSKTQTKALLSQTNPLSQWLLMLWLGASRPTESVSPIPSTGRIDRIADPKARHDWYFSFFLSFFRGCSRLYPPRRGSDTSIFPRRFRPPFCGCGRLQPARMPCPALPAFLSPSISTRSRRRWQRRPEHALSLSLSVSLSVHSIIAGVSHAKAAFFLSLRAETRLQALVLMLSLAWHFCQKGEDVSALGYCYS